MGHVGDTESSALSISHDVETPRALSEPREAPAGCCEVTNSFGFTQEERRAGGAARLRHPGQDPFQGCKGNRETAKARSIFVLDSRARKRP